jgi:hypothetical protein
MAASSRTVRQNERIKVSFTETKIKMSYFRSGTYKNRWLNFIGPAGYCVQGSLQESRTRFFPHDPS